MEYFEQLKSDIDIIIQKEEMDKSSKFKKKEVSNRLQDETVRNLFVEKVGQKKMQKVQNYHRQLSNIYGVNVGIILDQPGARNNNME